MDFAQDWRKETFPMHRVLVGLVILIALACATCAQELRVAAAADLQFAMLDLAAQFEKQTGTKMNVSYGSSGNFFSQIQNGAPFDLFFSADSAYPKNLDAAGLAEPRTLYTYAVGRIVLWMPSDAKIDLSREKWHALLDARVLKIAIANPEHAPYGRAAVAALKKAGVYERVETKLVFGENISQAAQFVQSGNAQVGIIALSLTVSPGMKDGQRWEIPADFHPPIEQTAVILRSAANKDGARAFLAFIKSAPGRAILSNYGFTLPSVSAAPAAPDKN